MFYRSLRRSVPALALVLIVLLAGCSSDNSGSGPIHGPQYGPTDFFVSAAGGSDDSSGVMAKPFATIQRAIDTAAITGGRVFVAEGTYNENITLATGVSLFGGYKDGTFVRDTAHAKTTISGSQTTIRLPHADSVTIDGFTIVCADATTPSGSSIGISLDAAVGVTISHNVITTGNGANGLGHSKPDDPAKADDGSAGTDANSSGCVLMVCPATPGGAGGYGYNDAYPISGGHGAWGRAVKADDGEAGEGPAGGAGGASKGVLGGAGDNGSNGGPGVRMGTSGAGGLSFGTISIGRYIAANGGGSGANGDCGSGGGGGGGGGAILAKGASGGGGGAGGYGGYGGPGGGGGGASIGILVSSGSQATITDNVFTAGNGGNGGSGAPGGSPGQPGLGGAGGGGNGWGAAAGHGGNGGDGQYGGHGGGGGGGPAVGIAEDALSSTILTNNTFTIGTAGAGGPSSGNNGENGLAAEYIKR